ncbi:hypothetical protein ACE3MZ_02995 [Paenibacillus sp. WLX1005]|uniref:hypothetical protein n=1 Tax=Paenibacillus sp. WLX1005 TaxID=3243766 RepID=UPI003983F47B
MDVDIAVEVIVDVGVEVELDVDVDVDVKVDVGVIAECPATDFCVVAQIVDSLTLGLDEKLDNDDIPNNAFVNRLDMLNLLLKSNMPNIK